MSFYGSSRGRRGDDDGDYKPAFIREFFFGLPAQAPMSAVRRDERQHVQISEKRRKDARQTRVLFNRLEGGNLICIAQRLGFKRRLRAEIRLLL